MTPNHKSSNPATFLQHNIKCLRKQLKWSQEDLGQHVGLNRGNIASYENGTAEPKICNLIKLADVFRVPVNDFMLKDLSCKNALAMANARYVDRSKNHDEIITHFRDQQQKLHQLINSLHNCYQHRVQQIENTEKSEVVRLSHYVDEMHDTGLELSKELDLLIEYVRCGTSPK